MIRGGTVVTVDHRLGNLTAADVVIDDGLIVSVGEAGDVEDAEVIDAAGGIVMPGFVDTHRHTWQAALRNIASDWTLGHYFTGLHFGFSPHFRPEDTYIGNLLGRLEALESGITTMLDWSHNLRHARPCRCRGGRAGRGRRQVDLRPRLRRTALAGAEQPAARRGHPAGSANERFPSDDGLVTLALAARGPQFTPLDVAAHDFGLARELDLRITVHVGDGEWGKTRPIDALDGLGLLGPDVTYVHCNTIGDDELDRMAATGRHGVRRPGRRVADGPRLARDRPAAPRGDPTELLDRRVHVERRRHVRDDPHGDRVPARARQCGGRGRGAERVQPRPARDHVP